MTEFETRESAWIALNRVQKRIYRHIEQKLVKAGLPKLNWYDVLWELENSPQGLRPYQLEAQLLFDQSSFSRQVARMAEEGLIHQARAEGDGRGKVLHITDKGRDLRLRMWEIYGPMIDSEMTRAISGGALDDIAQAVPLK